MTVLLERLSDVPLRFGQLVLADQRVDTASYCRQAGRVRLKDLAESGNGPGRIALGAKQFSSYPRYPYFAGSNGTRGIERLARLGQLSVQDQQTSKSDIRPPGVRVEPDGIAQQGFCAVEVERIEELARPRLMRTVDLGPGFTLTRLDLFEQHVVFTLQVQGLGKQCVRLIIPGADALALRALPTATRAQFCLSR